LPGDCINDVFSFPPTCSFWSEQQSLEVVEFKLDCSGAVKAKHIHSVRSSTFSLCFEPISFQLFTQSYPFEPLNTTGILSL
jgi:hypothetical protein